MQYVGNGGGSVALILTGATQLRGSAFADRPALDGAPPLDAAVALQGHISADVAGHIGHLNTSAIMIRSVSLAQVQALQFHVPLPADLDGVTGEVVPVHLSANAGATLVRLGQVFSFTGRDVDADKKVLIAPEPLVPGGVVYVLHEAFISLDSARLAISRHAAARAGSVQAAAAAAANAPAHAAGLGGLPAGPQPGQVPAAAVLPVAGAQLPAAPAGVAPAVAPAPAGAAGAPHVHWAAGVAVPPGVGQHPAGVPVAPGFPVPVLAPGILPGPPAANPGIFAGPPAANLSHLPQCIELFRRCTPADLADLNNLDSLVAVLAPTAPVPPHAVTPASDPMARLEYANQQLELLVSNGVAIPPPSQDGWAGVFPCVRAMRRSSAVVAPGAPVS